VNSPSVSDAKVHCRVQKNPVLDVILAGLIHSIFSYTVILKDLFSIVLPLRLNLQFRDGSFEEKVAFDFQKWTTRYVIRS
jgi:hypothetical protein